LIGVYGTNEGLGNDPDGVFLPAPAPRLNELFVKKAATSLGIKVIPGRGSVLTAPLPGNKDRGQCFTVDNVTGLVGYMGIFPPLPVLSYLP
jgi:hypothetical protein